MKKRISVLFFALIFMGAMATGARAAGMGLVDWAFNVDGTVYDIWSGPLPAAFDDSAFNWGTGLGAITIDVTGAGPHTVLSFFDHEIDVATNTFFNEYGSVSGSSAPGQTWEIDEPGWVFGDIYEHVTGWNGVDYSGTIGLDNSNAVPVGFEDDVSMAMGWDFTLGAGDSAKIGLFLSDTVVPSGFYLTQTDPDSNANIYFSSDLDITAGGAGAMTPIPEPGTIILLGSGLVGLALTRKRWAKFSK